MGRHRFGLRAGIVAAVFGMIALGPLSALPASDVGEIKVSRGAVHIERGGQQLPGPIRTRIQQSDVIITGADGSAGITFMDDSLLSVGPNSVLAIDRFEFDSTTHRGTFDSSLKKGTLAAVSGKLAKQSPDAMKVRTPAAVLGVRGTEFVVRTSESPD
jgi:hypothetical protein